jgi:condensin complex subunit 2
MTRPPPASSPTASATTPTPFNAGSGSLHKKRARNEHSHGNNRERLTRDVLARQNMTVSTMPIQLPVVPTVTPEQMYSNFEEWIKMATDNVRKDTCSYAPGLTIINVENQCKEQLELCSDRLLSRNDFYPRR